MESILIKILAFLVAIALLVAVHEFGHFWVARKLGVKVLRFSIGFGKPLWTKQGQVDNTEYVIAAIPLGGYVKMLDEREGDVDQNEAHRAFNRQPLWIRSAIVAAGPVFNFIFAIFAFWLVLINGETGLRPIVGEIADSSVASEARFNSGEEILSVNGAKTPTWSIVVQELAASAISGNETVIGVRDEAQFERERVIPAGAMGEIAETKDLLKHIGIDPYVPEVPAIIGELIDGEPAQQSGLQSGDKILSANSEAIGNWRDWVLFVQARPEQLIQLEISRNGQVMNLDLTPRSLAHGDKVIGRIGATNQPVPGLVDHYRVQYELGLFEAVPAAIERTWEYSVLTLKVIGRIISGHASVHNLSGPITIADAAGKTASIGFVQFFKFLAIVSVSLGVLNLLPIPVLDGGHLVYFAIEGLKGSPVSEEFMIQTQKIGMTILLGVMVLAFYVDFMRYFN